MNPSYERDKEFQERIIALDRVTRVVKGGRRFRFRATVVIGDSKSKVGVGVGKGRDTQTSITKAVAAARQAMIEAPILNGTIAHEVQVSFNGATVMLKPARPGTGVIAGGAVRSVLEAAGIKDILTKALGSSNKINNARATIDALASLPKNPPKQEAPKTDESKKVAAKAEAKKADKPAKAKVTKPSKTTKAKATEPAS